MKTGDAPNWDQRYEKLFSSVPWILLVPSVALSVGRSDQTWTDRAITLGLAGIAASWVYLRYTRVPAQDRKRTGPMLMYFIVLVLLFAALMARDLAFLFFTISGFFHAYHLKPWPLAVGGVFATSVVLNTMTMGFPQSLGDAPIYVGVIVIQTAAISAGGVLSEKMEDEHRQRKETVTKLETALEENAGLHAQLLTQAREAGVLDERQRLAREIHDTLAQGLAGIITQVQAAQRVWDSPGHARPHVDRALGLARDSLAEARRSVQAMRPQELDDAHLPDALGDLARNWAKDLDVALNIDVYGDRVPLSPAIEVTLFRVAQEALTNVAKHAQASRVGLTLSYLDDVVLLDVRDDGTGITSSNGQGFGLNSMKQRVRSVGGTLEIESTVGEGTAISAGVPAITAGAG